MNQLLRVADVASVFLVIDFGSLHQLPIFVVTGAACELSEKKLFYLFAAAVVPGFLSSDAMLTAEFLIDVCRF